MPPFGQAMRLIKNPGTYLTLIDGLDKRAVTQLFGRNIQNSHISQPDPLHHLASLGHGQHAVNG